MRPRWRRAVSSWRARLWSRSCARSRSRVRQGCSGDIEMPLVGVLAAMERTGMYVEPDRLAALSTELGAQIDELAARIRELAGDETFNISSPMQLSHILFDVMGLPTKGLKKTHRGYYSTTPVCWRSLRTTTRSCGSSLSIARRRRSSRHTSIRWDLGAGDA